MSSNYCDIRLWFRSKKIYIELLFLFFWDILLFIYNIAHCRYACFKPACENRSYQSIFLSKLTHFTDLALIQKNGTLELILNDQHNWLTMAIAPPLSWSCSIIMDRFWTPLCMPYTIVLAAAELFVAVYPEMAAVSLSPWVRKWWWWWWWTVTAGDSPSPMVSHIQTIYIHCHPINTVLNIYFVHAD